MNQIFVTAGEQTKFETHLTDAKTALGFGLDSTRSADQRWSSLSAALQESLAATGMAYETKVNPKPAADAVSKTLDQFSPDLAFAIDQANLHYSRALSAVKGF